MSDPQTLARVLAAAESAVLMNTAEVEREERAAGRRMRREMLLAAFAGDRPITDDDVERLVLGTAIRTTALAEVHAWFGRWRVGDSRAPRVLALLGPVGCGKTVAAAYVLAREHGRYVSADRLRLIGSSRAPADRVELDALARTRVLIIDDVGAERDEDGMRAVMFDLLNRRQAGVLTLLTGNLEEERFRNWLDLRALSRLMQIGKIVTVAGDDLRLRIAQ